MAEGPYRIVLDELHKQKYKVIDGNDGTLIVDNLDEKIAEETKELLNRTTKPNARLRLRDQKE